MYSVTTPCNVFGNKIEWVMQIIPLGKEEPRSGQNDDILPSTYTIPSTQQVDDIAFVFKKRSGCEVNAYYLRPLERSR